MRTYVDHHFLIGQAHATGGGVCQDYATSGIDARGAHAIVADGCSSGGKTDVGARIIAQIHVADPTGDPVDTYETVRHLLNLSNNDMLATSASIHCDPQGARLRLLGDGVLAHVTRSGVVHIDHVAWAENMPFYPAYDNAALVRFIDRHGDNPDCLRIDRWSVLDDKVNHDFETRGVLKAIHGVVRTFDRRQLDDIMLLAVMTDGVAQVDGFDVVDTVRALLSFKSLAGRFVVRRLNRFVRDAELRGNGPRDDIAMAVIRLEHEGDSGAGDGS